MGLKLDLRQGRAVGGYGDGMDGSGLRPWTTLILFMYVYTVPMKAFHAILLPYCWRVPILHCPLVLTVYTDLYWFLKTWF